MKAARISSIALCLLLLAGCGGSQPDPPAPAGGAGSDPPAAAGDAGSDPPAPAVDAMCAKLPPEVVSRVGGREVKQPKSERSDNDGLAFGLTSIPYLICGYPLAAPELGGDPDSEFRAAFAAGAGRAGFDRERDALAKSTYEVSEVPGLGDAAFVVRKLQLAVFVLHGSMVFQVQATILQRDQAIELAREVLGRL
jgi:hypothetical protein